MQYYRRTIVFSKRPLKEAFCYRDVFIIQPITRANIPHSPYAKHYPAFLDYRIDEKEGLEEYDLMQKDIDKAKKICSLLTALSNFEFFTYNSNMSQWGFVAPSVSFEELSKEEEDRYNETAKTSVWVPFAVYTYPEFAQDCVINSLSILGDNTEMNLDENPLYFTDNPIQEQKEKVTFQEKLTDVLDSFYSLPEDDQRTVYSAIVLVANGIKLGVQHQSIGFVSFISSIETMIDFENKQAKKEFCEACGQPKYSVRKKFLDYLAKYVSRTDTSKKKFDRLYKLRSNIAHTGKLFLMDVEFSLLNKDTMNEEWYTFIDAQQLARLSLFRWLLLNNPNREL